MFDLISERIKNVFVRDLAACIRDSAYGIATIVQEIICIRFTFPGYQLKSTGIEPTMALDVVVETVQGAVEVLRSSGQQPKAEIARVTTPGGITLRGLEAMEQGGFSKAVADGIKASK